MDEPDAKVLEYAYRMVVSMVGCYIFLILLNVSSIHPSGDGIYDDCGYLRLYGGNCACSCRVNTDSTIRLLGSSVCASFGMAIWRFAIDTCICFVYEKGRFRKDAYMNEFYGIVHRKHLCFISFI